jgi:diguanylate cyclase (GGDEF)-like protein
MPAQSRLWPVFLVIGFLGIFVLGVGIFLRNMWLTSTLAIFLMVYSTWVASAYLKSLQNSTMIFQLSQLQPAGDNLIAGKLLTELSSGTGERRSLALKAQELISENFQFKKFVIFFREDDRYIPRVFAGINKLDLSSPPFQRLGVNLKRGMAEGVHSTSESDIRLAFKNEGFERMISPVVFAYSWGRSCSVLVVADDEMGYFSQMSKDHDFNRVFWPGLDASLRMNQKLYEMNIENRQFYQQLGQAKRELSELNRELKNKLLDIQSFVKVSNQLYSLFNEEQLFQTLKGTVTGQLNAAVAEIMVPSGEGKFAVSAGSNLPSPERLELNVESEICDLIAKSPRPVVLPLAGSGLSRDEPFLGEAIKAGIMVASAIRTGGKTACILLIGEKNDKSQYSNQDLDFLFVISNIASLALDNIYQYSTIEKLSYTDSMTGIYNYRYFYKRLSEETLRAKRYDRELGLVIFDIDSFKSFNDNYGHQAGDLILKQLSDLITKTIRSIDVVSRYGGEEFCIIMPDTGVGNCAVFIERLRTQIAEFKFESEFFPKGSNISVSVGGAVYPHHAPTPDRLIYCADMALLKAKSLGRNRAIMYELEFSLDARSSEGGFDESHQESIF